MYNKLIISITKIKIRLYTLVQKYRFAHLGKNTSISPPISVTNPGFVSIGDDVTIMDNVLLNVKENKEGPSLRIGNGVYIGRFSHINALRQVLIDDYVLINHLVTLGDETHRFEDTNTPILRQGTYFDGAVHLEAGCWIGTGSIIMPGVTVGKNSVVGANSVVNNDVPDFTVVAGAPAKIIRSLK